MKRSIGLWQLVGFAATSLCGTLLHFLYKRSCELSTLYSLYRQDYCGCEFSKKAAEKRKSNDI